MGKVRIIVATHKKYEMPKSEMYLPVHVGAKGKETIENYQRDDEGENISEKNPYFCELTGLYWAWKNLNADYIGLAHYRRHFSISKKLPNDVNGRIKLVLNENEASKMLENTDIILPGKRKYYIPSSTREFGKENYTRKVSRIYRRI